jgi:hypothetical protein
VEQIVTNPRLCLRLKGFIPGYGNQNSTRLLHRSSSCAFPGASYVPSMVHGLGAVVEFGKASSRQIGTRRTVARGRTKRVPEFELRLQPVRLAASCRSDVCVCPLHKTSSWSWSARSVRKEWAPRYALRAHFAIALPGYSTQVSFLVHWTRVANARERKQEFLASADLLRTVLTDSEAKINGTMMEFKALEIRRYQVSVISF